jgi:hypothetical protein
MAAWLAVFAAFVVGAAMRAWTKRPLRSWLSSCIVVPSFVLFAEFVLPYQGGGASMWPIALIFGGIYGAVAGATGVGLASWIVRRDA